MLKTLPLRTMAWGGSVGVLAGLLVVAFELVQGEICEYNQATEDEDCTTYSLFPFLLIQIGKTLNDYGVAITGIATIFLAIITGGLVFLARDQSNTTRAQLRAYVGIKSGHLRLTADGKAAVAIRINNFGQTPAYEVSNSIWIENATKFSALLDNKKFIIPGKNAIFPQSSQRILFNGTFNIPPGDEVFYTFVFGSIIYKDAFGRRQMTNFRYTAHMDVSDGRANLSPCDEGNDAT